MGNKVINIVLSGVMTVMLLLTGWLCTQVISHGIMLEGIQESRWKVKDQLIFQDALRMEMDTRHGETIKALNGIQVVLGRLPKTFPPPLTEERIRALERADAEITEGLHRIELLVTKIVENNDG